MKQKPFDKNRKRNEIGDGDWNVYLAFKSGIFSFCCLFSSSLE